MLISGKRLSTAAAGDPAAKATEVEQVHAFFRNRSSDPTSARLSAQTLQSRLDALRRRVSLVRDIAISEHVMTLLQSSQAD